MPDFFLISGLFLARVIDRDWRTYLDRKVVHFVYFYVLWMTIQFAFKAPGLAAEHGGRASPQLYLDAFIEPFGTLWFIYLLPIFFVVTKLTRRVPPIVVWLIAAALEIAPIETGWTVIDEFASRFVYFYTGYMLRPHLRARRDRAGAARARSPGCCSGGLLNGMLVFDGLGRLAVRVAGARLARRGGHGRGLGADGARATCSSRCAIAASNSIVIYLAFFLPMAATPRCCSRPADHRHRHDLGDRHARRHRRRAGLFWAVRGTPLRFLFERPERFWRTRAQAADAAAGGISSPRPD